MPGQECFRFFTVEVLRTHERNLQQIFQLIQSGTAALAQSVPRHKQEILIIDVDGVIKELAEDIVLFVAGGFEKLFEFALGQHDDPAELLRVQAEQFLAACRDLAGTLNWCGVRFDDQRADRPVAILVFCPLFFSEMDPPFHGVFFPVLRETKLDCRIRGFRHIVAVKHVRLPIRAACDAEESKHDRVKNRSLSGTGIPGDQIQAVLEFIKRQNRLLGI